MTAKLRQIAPGPTTFDGLQWYPRWVCRQEPVLLPGPTSIDSITDALIAQGIITLEEDYEAGRSARNLVFSVLGWQMMLYQTDFASYDTGGYKIVDDMNGDRGETRIYLDHPALSARKNLPGFHLWFGMILPPRNYCAMDDTDDRALFSQTKVLNSKDLEAHMLTKVCGVRFQWVDSLLSSRIISAVRHALSLPIPVILPLESPTLQRKE